MTGNLIIWKFEIRAGLASIWIERYKINILIRGRGRGSKISIESDIRNRVATTDPKNWGGLRVVPKGGKSNDNRDVLKKGRSFEIDGISGFREESGIEYGRRILE